MEKTIRFETTAIHAGNEPEPRTGAIMVPIFQTSTYVQDGPGQAKEGHDYARSINPTRTALEQNLAALEGGIEGLSFSSGCAALNNVLQMLASGDHVIVGDDVYGGTFRLFDKVYRRFGIEYSQVNPCQPNQVLQSIKANTKLVWLESPTNPLLQLADIATIAKLVKERNAGILVAVDNTFASPYLQRPLALGADIVSHSSTKYIGGHSDVIGGALVVKDKALAERLRFLQNAVGSVPSPLDCFLLLRSTKTLAIRMERHCENALKIATFLENHSAVARVSYPGLESHPQHQLARRQMRLGGGMVSIWLKGGIAAANKMLTKVKLFALAESLGGVESLIEHPGLMTHASIPDVDRKARGLGDDLVRLSVGIENVQDLLEDLEQALK